LYHIKSTSQPFITLQNDIQPLKWDRGRFLSHRLSNSYAKLHARGLQFRREKLFFWDSTKWNTLPCKVSHDALCQNETIWFFPTYQVDLPDDFKQLSENSYLKDFEDLKVCTSSNTNRKLHFDDTRYDTSLCDLFDAKMNFIFEGREVYWRQDNTSVYVMFLFALVAIYLVTCVASNILDVFQHSGVEHAHYLIYLSASFLFVFFYTLFQSLIFFTSYNDIYLFFLLSVFVFFELFAAIVYGFERPGFANETSGGKTRRLMHMTPNLRRVSISVPVSILLMLSACMYYSFDTPYTTILTTIFGIRTFYMLIFGFSAFYESMCCPGILRLNNTEFLFLLFDLVTFSNLLDKGVVAYFETKLYSNTIQLLSTLLSFLGGILFFIANDSSRLGNGD
jgi:hypothetical protein